MLRPDTQYVDNPQDIIGWGLEVSAFAAAGHGVSGQITGTGPAGTGACGGAVGYAAGAGAGISGMGTYAWYNGQYDLSNLPEDIKNMFFHYIPELRMFLENSCE